MVKRMFRTKVGRQDDLIDPTQRIGPRRDEERVVRGREVDMQQERLLLLLIQKFHCSVGKPR